MACGVLKPTAGDKVVKLVEQLLGSGAAAAAKSRLDAVAAALRGGACAPSFAATVAAALDAACSAAVQAGARQAFAAALPELASAARTTNPAAAAESAVVVDIKFIVRLIPLLEKLLVLVIPAEVKAAIAVVAVAVGLYYGLCAAPAAGAPAEPIVTKVPGGGGASQLILKSALKANPAFYFRLLACSDLLA